MFFLFPPLSGENKKRSNLGVLCASAVNNENEKNNRKDGGARDKGYPC